MRAVGRTKRAYPAFDHPKDGRNPSQLPRELPIELVDRHRVERCSFYEDCSRRTAATQWRSWTCARCPLFPGGAWLADGEKPDLTPPIEPPLVTSFEDLAAVVASGMRAVSLDRSRRPNAYVPGGSECSDCGNAIAAGACGWYCPKCSRLVCATCRTHHRCA
jgi:hypothetical protein